MPHASLDSTVALHSIRPDESHAVTYILHCYKMHDSE